MQDNAKLELEKVFNKLTFENRNINCEKHGVVTVSVPRMRKDGLSCPLCEKEKEEIAAENRRLDRLRSRGIPEKFLNTSFDTFIPPNNEALACLSLLKQLVAHKSDKNILMYGESGCGKTHLSCAAVIAYDGVYTTYENMSVKIRDSYKNGREEYVRNYFCSAPLLVIDEADKGKDSQAKGDYISSIFRERYENNKPTWIVGNFDEDWFIENLDDAVIRRFEDNGKSILCDWASEWAKKQNI